MCSMNEESKSHEHAIDLGCVEPVPPGKRKLDVSFDEQTLCLAGKKFYFIKRTI